MKHIPRSTLACLACLLWLPFAGCDGGGGGPQDDAGVDVETGDDSVADDASEDVSDAWDEGEDVTGDTDLEPEVPDEPDPVWERFEAEREGYLARLAEPILYCVEQPDTTNPAFHGCIDWHSAVEGVWALLAVGRVTGDTSYTEAAEAVIAPDLLAQELAQMGEGGPMPTEIPYGYSWFLALAVEREASGETDLVALADAVSAEMVTYVTGLTRGRIDGAVMADDYQNLSWNLLNIWQHAVLRGDDALATQMQDFTRNEILPREPLCPISRTPLHTDEFLAPCLMRARLLLTVLAPDEAAAWAEANIPADMTLVPISVPETLHSAGLNFSRSWNLLDLYEATGDRDWRVMYVEHIEAHMAMPEYWNEDYDAYSHWVPQFGVYAILRSY